MVIKVTNFSRLEVLGGHSIDWLFTHIKIRLERGWVNLFKHICYKRLLWLAGSGTKEF